MTDLAVRSNARAAKQVRWRLGFAALMFVGYFGLGHLATSSGSDIRPEFFLVPAAAFFMCAVLVSLGSRLGWLLGLLATVAFFVLFSAWLITWYQSPDPQHLVGYTVFFGLHLVFFGWVGSALLSQQATVAFVRRRKRWVDDEPEEEAVAVSSLFVWPEGHVVGRVGAAAESGGTATALAEPPAGEPPAKHRSPKRSFEPPTWAHVRRRAAVVLTLCLGGVLGLVAYNSGWLDRTTNSDGVRALSLADMPGYQVETHPTASLFYGQCRADKLLTPAADATGLATAFGKPGYDGSEFAFETLFQSTAAPTLYQRVIARAGSCAKQDAIAWRGSGQPGVPAHIVPGGGPSLGDRSSWWVNTKADPAPPASIQITPGESLNHDPSRPRWIVLLLHGDTIMQVAAPTQDEAARMAETALAG